MTAPAVALAAPREALEAFRSAAGHIAGTVAVVIATTPDGPHAATASSVVVASPDPPMLAVLFRDGGRACAAIESSGEFTASLLRADDHALARRLANPARPAGAAALAGVDLIDAAGEAPALARAAAWFACAVRDAARAGDHRLFIADVLACGRDTGASPLVHHRGLLHRLGAPVAPGPWLEPAREDLAADW